MRPEEHVSILSNRAPGTPTPAPPAARSGPPSPPSTRAEGVQLARRRRRRRWVIAGVAIAVVAGSVVYWGTTRASAPVPYVTAPVTRGPVAQGVSASGTVNPVLTIQVGSYVSGIIQSVSCDFNTEVKKGQVCAKIDPRPYETVVAQDQANLATGTAQVEKDQTALQYAKVSYQRAQDLAARALVSQDDLDSAKSAYDQAQAQVTLDQSVVAERKAALQAAQVNLGYTDIVSPVDGTVVSRNVTVGQTVAASFQTPTLFLIANDLTKMQVDASVSESDIGAIHAGDAASFTVDAFPGRTFSGQVTEVRQAPQSVQNVVTYDVVVAVPNPDRLLKPGMTASVRIVTDERDEVVRVPDRALRFTPAGAAPPAPGAPAAREGASAAASHAGSPAAGVWVLRRGQPVRVPVTIGLDDGTNAEVVSGDLQPGDQVIVSDASASSSAPPAPARPPRFGG